MQAATDGGAAVLERSFHKVAVILSSSWRKPSHAERVQLLEDALSRHLGVPFAFAGRTRLQDDSLAPDRLVAIAHWVQCFCEERKRLGEDGALRILVLEDFFITPFGKWSCGADHIENVADAEQYILSHGLAERPDMKLKIVHTYDQFTTRENLLVQAGEGLTMRHFCQAMTFLGSKCPHCRQKQLFADCSEGTRMRSFSRSTSGSSDEVLAESHKHLPFSIQAWRLWRCLSSLWPWIAMAPPWAPWRKRRS